MTIAGVDLAGRAAVFDRRLRGRLPLSLRSGRAIGTAVTDTKKIAGIFALMLMLPACGVTDPYVHRPGEFNREAAGFNVEPADISEVSICYQSLVTGLERVAAAAEERCGEFERTAELLGIGYGQCPLLKPARARFACIRLE
jgi:hypothetical protein